MVGEDLFKIARPETCHLTTAAYQSMTKYDELLKAHCSRHKVLPKLYAIHQTYEGSLTLAQQNTMEAIDRVKTEAMIYAEKNCRSLCMGEVDYSPDVNKARGLRYVWQLVVKHLSGQNVKPDKIRKVAVAGRYPR